MSPEIEELETHVENLATAHVFSWLLPKYRRARRAHLAVCRSKSPSRATALADFEELHQYLIDLHQLESNKHLELIAGQHWQGINTPFHELFMAADWRRQLEGAASEFGDGATAFTEKWWTMPDGQLAVFVTTEQSVSAASQLAGLESAVTELRLLLRNSEEAKNSEPLVEVARPALELIHDARTTADRLEAVGIPASMSFVVADDAISQVDQLQRQVSEVSAAKEPKLLLGQAFAGCDTDLGRVDETVATFQAVRDQVASSELLEFLCSRELATKLPEVAKALELARAAAEALVEREQLFAGLSGMPVESWYGSAESPDAIPVRQLLARNANASAAPHLLAEWLDFQHSLEGAAALGLRPLAKAVLEGELDPRVARDSLRFVYWTCMAREAFRSHPELNRFSGLTHDEIRQRFQRLDQELIQLTRAVIACGIDDRTNIPSGNGVGPVATHTELALLRREIRKQKRHIPLRQLLHRAGAAIQSLTPCFMMSPLSAALYLVPGAIKFDLVVMDEASQVRPEDALGVIARGRQVIVVGDQNQLPPTTFFDVLRDDDSDILPEDDLGQAARESESILDLAAQVYPQTRLLKWHYRSEHESLIAFSNHEFYQDRLVVFPSPRPAGSRLGISVEHIARGIYREGVNIAEAQRVAQAAIAFMEQHPNESLGVATMNIRQRERIEAEVEHLLKDSPLGQDYVERWQKSEIEQFFVKNLENVQGDERDVIFISVTYGPDESGRVMQRFGPINGHAGHRRLNVLFTRAKRRVVIFSSMRSDQIRIDEKSHQGTVVLKNYLDYAESGRLAVIGSTGREPDSDFEREVANQLRQHGHECVAQLGVAGYFIDIAVRHPRRDGRWLLGIECDGATYHAGSSARERDRLRQMKLEDLGWRIHRIWSTEWFKNPEREVRRMLQAISLALQSDRADG